MKNLAAAFSFILLLSSCIANAQSIIVGNWKGALHQNPTDRTPFTEYKFSMKLKEANGKIVGVSTLITGPNFGILELTGTFANNEFTFQEYKIKDEKKTTAFSWCLKGGTLNLTQVGTQLKLEGDWTGYVMTGTVKNYCSPGKILLTKEIDGISLQGFVVNEKTMEAISSKIKIVNKTTGKETKLTTTSGEFDIKLPGKNKYELTVEAKGFLTKYEHVQLDSSVILNIHMTPIETGQKVALKSVLFEKSTTKLIGDSYAELDRLSKLMMENSSVIIELQGHTSNEGDANKNISLSEQRVIVIKNYLISKGVSSARIKTKAFGEQSPIVPNTTEENRKLNRRVEFMIISK